MHGAPLGRVSAWKSLNVRCSSKTASIHDTTTSIRRAVPPIIMPASVASVPGVLTAVAVVLSLVAVDVTSLPESLHTNAKLRCVVLWLSGLALVDVDNEPWDLAKVQMVERELKPLSLAQPQIRFQLLGPDSQGYDDDQISGWDGWWHAECEVDLRRGLAQADAE